MKITDLYRDMCNKLGKGKVWAMSNDELCDYIEENYNVQEKELE